MDAEAPRLVRAALDPAHRGSDLQRPIGSLATARFSHAAFDLNGRVADAELMLKRLSGFSEQPSYFPHFGFWLDLTLDPLLILYNSMTGPGSPLNGQGSKTVITRVWGAAGEILRFQAVVGNLGTLDLAVTSPVDLLIE